MTVYKSCNCRWCRSMPSSVKTAHKRQAHRAFRRLSKKLLRDECDDVPIVSTGYKA